MGVFKGRAVKNPVAAERHSCFHHAPLNIESRLVLVGLVARLRFWILLTDQQYPTAAARPALISSSCSSLEQGESCSHGYG